MAQKKSHEVDSWLGRPDPAVWLVLVYGPDRGMVTERARRYAAATGLPLDDPFSVIRLDASNLAGDPGRLVDEARTVPMFATRRLIWVLDAGTDKAIADAVKLLISEPPRDAIMLIEAGDLKKGAALRTVVEAGTGAMALPCYADDARALDRLIDEEMTRAGLTISLDARQALKAALGGDRLASRAELEKLVLYCSGRGKVGREDVAAATGDASASSLDDAIDAVLSGRLADFETAFQRLAASGTHPFLVLGAAMRQYQALQAMRHTMDRDRKSAGSAVASARPPVFFSRRSIVEAALQSASAESCARALDRIAAAILETRRRPDLADAIARQAMLALAVENARGRR